MLDLAADSAQDVCSLAKASFSKDGKAAKSLIFDLSLVCAIDDASDADVIDKVLRGARPYFDAYRDIETKGSVTVNPPELAGRLVLIHADDGVEVLDATVAVLKIEMRKAAKSTACVLSIRAHGLPPETAARLAEYLDARLTAEWTNDRAQQSLPFPAAQTSKAVQVVTAQDGAGGWLFGVQTGIDGDRVLLDDFGTPFEVSKSVVTSKVILSPPSGSDLSTEEVVAPFAEEIREKGIVPSWRYFILGIAAIRGTDLEGVYRVTEPELRRAVQIAAEAA